MRFNLLTLNPYRPFLAIGRFYSTSRFPFAPKPVFKYSASGTNHPISSLIGRFTRVGLFLTGGRDNAFSFCRFFSSNSFSCLCAVFLGFQGTLHWACHGLKWCNGPKRALYWCFFVHFQDSNVGLFCLAGPFRRTLGLFLPGLIFYVFFIRLNSNPNFPFFWFF